MVGPNGNPVAGARVSAFQWKKSLSQTKSAPDGRFRIAFPRSDFEGTRIVASSDGFGPAWIDAIPVNKDDDITLRLVPDDVPIEGRILDLEGQPVRAVRVKIGRIDAPKEKTLNDLIQAVRETIRVLAKTKSAFRSKDLKLLRQKLTKVVDSWPES